MAVMVPPVEHLAAVKLGLPVDYKNNHDAAMLLARCDIDRLVRTIQGIDDWDEMVLRRMPKLKGRIKQSGQLENLLALMAGLNISQHLALLEHIEKRLREGMRGE